MLQAFIFCHEYFSIAVFATYYYSMERSIGCKMAELEPIKGFSCTKTAISQKRLFLKI